MLRTMGSTGSVGMLVCLSSSLSAQSPQVGLQWDRFHDYAAQVRILRQMERAYPDLVDVRTYGTSYQDRDLYIVAVTNEKTGPLEEKPAVWLDAAYDGGETYTTEIALYFLNHLLAGYGSDSEITEILDTRGFYVVPNGNPDAGEQLYQKPKPGSEAGPFMGVSRNSWLIPFDDDGDGRIDEDPPEDLDGDGRILQMRLRDPLGHHVTDGRDARVMRVRRPWEKGQWRLFSTEGLDSDGDGRIDEDWYGGYDTNRNAPAEWDPNRIVEETAPYPLFAPESRAFVEAVQQRPNVIAMVNLHTSGWFPGGTLWEAPAGRSPDEFPDRDIHVIYRMLGEEYERLMRMAEHSGATAMNSYEGGKIWDSPKSGLMSDFGYVVLGFPSWVQENNVRSIDYNDDGHNEVYETILWNDRLKEKIFVPWKPFRHPQLGDVEIGGFVQDNDAHGVAPVETVPENAARITPWYLVLAKMAPLVRITRTDVHALGGGLHRVTATVRNVGVFDTYVTEHGKNVRVNAPTPVRLRLEGDGVEIVGGSASVDLGHLRGEQPGMEWTMYGTRWTATGPSGQSRTVEWVVRAPSAGRVRLTASSSKGGTHRVTVDLASGRILPGQP